MKNTSDLSQIWLVSRTGTGSQGTPYTIRNAASALFVQKQELASHSYITGTAMQSLYIREHPTLSGYFNINNDDDFKSNARSLHEAATGEVVAWYPGSSSPTGTEWKAEKVTEYTITQIRDSIAERSPYKTEVGISSVFRIISLPYGRAMSENASDNTVETEAAAADCSQYWRFVKTSTGYKIKNLYTGRYIKRQNGAFNTQYTTAIYSSDAFTVIRDSNYPSDMVYDLIDAGKVGLHCASSKSYGVIGWYATASSNVPASAWVLEKVDVSDEEITAAHRQYTETQNLVNSVNTLRPKVAKYFTDAACTTLKNTYASLTDSALRAEMSDLPEDLADAAVKIKNNSWQKWEKEFRIARYGIYSDPEYWARKLITSSYSRQNNPTGIIVDKNQPVYVFVGSDVPSGAKLSVESSSTTSVQASASKALQKGLNIFLSPEDSSQVYINYVSADGSLISSYDSLDIHIEGGRVNGYFNTAYHNDKEWEEMNADGLFFGPVIDVKGKRVMMHMNSRLFKQYVGNVVCGLMHTWDRVVYEEFNLMGLMKNEQYPDIYEGVYPEKFNNLMECVSDIKGHMYSTWFYTAYSEASGMKEVLNSEKMASGLNIWGPAHEIGHSNQGAIKIVGSTEVSNNLFSNLLVYKLGDYTSRGWNIQAEQPLLASRLSWPEREKNGDDPIQMFYSLYLYYHVLGHDTVFYQKVFHALRNDPLVHPSDPGITYGKDDYLKFARVCAKAAGANLNDFFRYWGFYYPLDKFQLLDYTNYTVTTTQADIDATVKYIAACGEPRPEVIFMEDRVRPVKKADGSTKLSLPESPYSECKAKMGQYEDYPLNLEPSGYIYSVNSRGLVSVPSSAKNAVGIIVYDKDSMLAYVANTHSFTLPDYLISEGGYKIYAVRADGELVKMYNKSADSYYTLRIYRGGNRTAVIRYTDGNAAGGTIPALSGNDIACISDASAPESLTALKNVVTKQGTAELIEIDDTSGFYSPVDFIASRLRFTSHFSSRISGKAYPFSFAVSALGGKARAESVSGVIQTGDTIYIDLTDAADSVRAGQPVFMVPASGRTGEWTYTGENVRMLGSGKGIEYDDGVTLSSNFASTSYSGTVWQYESDGLRFARSSEASAELYPFAPWLRSSRGDAPQYYYLRGEVINGISPVVRSRSTDREAVYDLDGLRVEKPVKGMIYIIGGKKKVY